MNVMSGKGGFYVRIPNANRIPRCLEEEDEDEGGIRLGNFLQPPSSPSSSLTPSSRFPSDVSVNTILPKERKHCDRRKERLNSELLLAVFKGDLEQTETLLKGGASPNATCRPGKVSACHVAAFKGHTGILDLLLSYKASGDLVDSNGRRPVHLAAWSDRLGILQILKNAHISIDTPISKEVQPLEVYDYYDSWSHNHDQLTNMVIEEMVQGSTPLHLACKRVNSPCVDFLLSEGAKINLKDAEGLTPLDVVGVSVDEEPIAELSPRPLTPSSSSEFSPQTPLSYIYDSIVIKPPSNHQDPNPTSMNRSVSVGSRNSFPFPQYPTQPGEGEIRLDGPSRQKAQPPTRQVISSLISRGARLPRTNVILRENSVSNQLHMAVTPLHTAVDKKDMDLIDFLLNESACLLTWNVLGETPLHLAVKNMSMEPLKKLLEFKQETPIVDVRDLYGRTPLHLAVMMGWAEGVCILLENGADVKTSSNSNETVLHFAATRGDENMLEELLSIPDSEKILEYRDKDYYTPLVRATENRETKCVKLLCKFKADPTTTLLGDITLLHIAVQNNSKEIVEFLLQDESTAKRLINVRCKNEKGGMTALHIAAERGYEHCAEELLEKDCDILAVTTEQPHNSTTALHLAARNGHESVVELILEKDAQKSLTARDGQGWYPLHVAAFSGQGPCVKSMLLHGADLAATIAVETGKRTGLEVITFSVPQPVHFLKDIFDSFIDSNDFPVNHPECEIQVKYNILTPQGTSNKQMSVLNAILNCGRRKLEEQLLLHPIVETFLWLKWKRLRGFFFFLMSFYILLTLSLTSLSFLHYVLQDYNKTLVAVSITISQIVLVVSFLPILITEILNLSQMQKYYLKDYETWVKWGVFIGTWAVGMTNPGVWWARYLAAVTVLLAWIELLFFIARSPTWGYYVLMFSRVAVNVFKVLGTFIFLILGFTFSFMIHFESTEPFVSFWGSFVKVLVMFIELDYSGTFPSEESTPVPGDEAVTDIPTARENEAFFFFLGRTMFAVFVVLVAIVLTNLMVGLAVSDISLLEAQGRTQRLAKQVAFLSLLEFFVYNDLLLKCLPLKVRKAVERRRCVSSVVIIRPSTPLGSFFKHLPSYIRESVLEKVASRSLRDEGVEMSLSLQRLDEKVQDLASAFGHQQRRSSQESLNTNKRTDNLEKKLSTVLTLLRNIRNEINDLRQSSSGNTTVIPNSSSHPQNGPILV